MSQTLLHIWEPQDILAKGLTVQASNVDQAEVLDGRVTVAMPLLVQPFNGEAKVKIQISSNCHPVEFSQLRYT